MASARIACRITLYYITELQSEGHRKMAAEPMMEELFTPSPSRQLSKNIQDIAGQ